MSAVLNRSKIAVSVALAVSSLSAVSFAQAQTQYIPPTVQVSVNNDAKTVSYQLDYDFGSNTNTGVERQIFLDLDRSFSTGYKVRTIGSEFALINNRLFRYTGVNGAWGWTAIKYVVYSDDGKKANWTIAQADLIPANTSFPSSIGVVGALGSSVVTAPTAVTQIINTNLPPLARNPLVWPFAKDSIWNMPIGSNAQFVPANLAANPGPDDWTPMPADDPERIVMTPNAPNTVVKYSSAGWTGADRCVPTSSTVLANLLIPDTYTVPNSRNNNGAAVLMADGRTVFQLQPFTRCNVGGVATSLVTFDPVDLHGNGISGGHGGSKLSSIGGSIRVGELRPLPAGTDPYTTGMRHALKINVDGSIALHSCSIQKDCSTWPALSADSGATTRYGSKPGLIAPPPEMKMGALLALATDVNIRSLGLRTDAAKQLAWTLQNYGGYIVDDAGGPAYNFSTEDGANGSFTAQFKADWGFEFSQRVRDGSDWVKDIQTIMSNLSVVKNNTAATKGGGGTPKQPLAPDLPF